MWKTWAKSSDAIDIDEADCSVYRARCGSLPSVTEAGLSRIAWQGHAAVR